MAEKILSASDIEYIRARGATEEKVLRQIGLCCLGAVTVTLERSATVGDGIVRVADGEREKLVTLHDEAARAGRCLKFVPASGAATRMFKDWHGVFNRGGFESHKDFEAFAANLSRYAFYGDLGAALSGAGHDLGDLVARGRGRELLDFILNDKGLHYAWKPKALLKFHQYDDRARTALEEHLVEAALYAKDGNGLCRIHFTVSEEHLGPVKELLGRVTGLYEKRLGVHFDIGLSIQSESTDTIAVDLENRPFRDRDGRLLFRPGGHGALLYNLDGIDGDIVFIKNIDNIVPDRLKDTTVLYKKILGGYLVGLQRELFGHLRALSERAAGESAIGAAVRLCRGSAELRSAARLRGAVARRAQTGPDREAQQAPSRLRDGEKRGGTGRRALLGDRQERRMLPADRRGSPGGQKPGKPGGPLGLVDSFQPRRSRLRHPRFQGAQIRS